VDDPLAARKLEQRRLVVALETEQAVRIVLENERVVLARDVEQRLARGDRERAPARVLKGRDRVDDAAAAGTLQRACERIEVVPVVRERGLLGVGAETPKDRERSVVAGRLDDEAPALADEVTREEVEPLQRSVRDDQA
jgi:hypothetical protein